MRIKYFEDSDAALVEFSDREPVETNESVQWPKALPGFAFAPVPAPLSRCIQVSSASARFSPRM